MIKYTFIFEYKGGTYIRQIPAPDLKEAIGIWANLTGPEIPKFNKKKKLQLLKAIEFYEPDQIDGMENVWHLHLDMNKTFGYLNVVATL